MRENGQKPFKYARADVPPLPGAARAWRTRAVHARLGSTMEICCVWWTTKEEALADAAPYTVRSVLVPAASLANTREVGAAGD